MSPEERQAALDTTTWIMRSLKPEALVDKLMPLTVPQLLMVLAMTPWDYSRPHIRETNIAVIQQKLTDTLTTHMTNLDQSARWLWKVALVLAGAQVLLSIVTLCKT
jgi:hypothetical protein